MPPENERRPSTPSPHPALRSPYLAQLEQAISTPVPDFASTLATPLTNRSSTNAVHESWRGESSVSSTARGDRPMSRPPITGSDLAESLDRMQSELDRWQSERDRLRAFLNNQQTRQLALEEQNLRLRRQHSRLAEENSRLFSTAANTSTTHLPRTILDADQGEDTLGNLATVIAEVGRESYSTRGSAPAGQRLYDWAAPPHVDEVPANEEHSGRMSREQLAARHRELDNALRGYRNARNAFRSERQGNDVGTVPTAGALRAYWTEDDSSPDQDRHRMIHTWAERHRRERQQRLQGDTTNQRSVTHESIEPPVSSESTDLKDRIRKTIQYLSKLRKTAPEDALSLARVMDLDGLYECEASHSPNELPLLVDSLPRSEPSSWLAPGMTWHGLQSTDRDYRSLPSMLSPTMRMLRHRDYFGRSTTRRGILEAQNSAASFVRHADDANSDSNMDADRYLSSLMRDPEGRWGFGSVRTNDLTNSQTDQQPTSTNPRAKSETDHWPVTVTLHSVDRDNMLVTGTMRASQIPDRTSAEGKSMESYFHGEIIDFRQHSLETDPGRGYKVGGLDTDARYWSRLGPFREAIEKQASSTYWDSSTWEDKLKTGDAKYWELLKAEERAYRETEADRVMMRCLANQTWLREKLGTEWILMRWKEKCFVKPILKSKPQEASATTSSTLLDSPQSTWGLTISGFYYIALHRQTGRIDGLYYDPGSQPYQSLRMAPEGNELVKAKTPGKLARAEGKPVTLKKWFPSVEFR